MFKIFGYGLALAVGAGVAAAAGFGTATPAAAAATPTFDKYIAYVRSGTIYRSKDATEKALTTGGGYARPRWSPDGKRIAYLHNGLLEVMNADGSGKRRLSQRAAAGPAWSPDGKWIAFSSMGCTGVPAIYRISTTVAQPTAQALFPAECRGVNPPPAPAPGPAPTGTLAERLRRDDAVAWSPDGKGIAFRGGDCEAIYDDCLTLGVVATGGEQVLAAYGGGGVEASGFAVLPAFRADGARITWTTWSDGDTLHVVEYTPATGQYRRLGTAGDREMAYVGSSRAVLTSQRSTGSWVTVLNLATGAHTPFHPGSQPAVQP